MFQLFNTLPSRVVH